MSCSNQAHNRPRLYEASCTDRYQEMLSTEKALHAVAQMGHERGDCSSQFLLAKEQINHGNGTTRDDGDVEAPELE